MHDGDVAIQKHLELLGSLGASHIGRDHAHLFEIQTLVLEVVHKNGHGGHMVHRHVEKALDGILMQIDGDDVINARSGNQVGDELGGDGLARRSLALLASAAVMRNHGRDAAGRSALGGIGHNQ